MKYRVAITAFDCSASRHVEVLTDFSVLVEATFDQMICVQASGIQYSVSKRYLRKFEAVLRED